MHSLNISCCSPVCVRAAVAASAVGNIAGGIAQQAAAGGGGAPEVLEQALYFLPLLTPLFSGVSKSNMRPDEQRTIRLSTADSRGLRYAEFL